jgi:hypothetical protein
MSIKNFDLPADPDMKKIAAALLTSTILGMVERGVAPDTALEACATLYSGLLTDKAELAVNSGAIFNLKFDSPAP